MVKTVSTELEVPVIPGYRRISVGAFSDDSPFIGPDHPTNEDRGFLHDDLVSTLKLAQGVTNYPLSCVLGVADGHGGDGASTFVSSNLHQMIGHNPYYESIDYPADEALASAVEEAIASVEEAFTSWAKKANDTSGCCLCVVAIRGSVLCAANVGDCQAVLVDEKGSVIPLSKPHRAVDPEERRRIRKAGGRVIDGRVMGVLEPSRVIGDIDIKRSWAECVIAKPHVTVRSLTYRAGQKPSYLAVASDGVWDTLDEQQVSSMVVQGFSKHSNPHLVAKELVLAARAAGSTDDVTAVVAKLG